MSELLLLTSRGRWLAQPAPASAGRFIPLKEHFFFPLLPVRAHRESSNFFWGGGFLHFEGYLALEFMFEDIVRLLRI